VDTRGDPELGAERREALALAVLVLLEKLTPVERAAYVLREAFDYSYERIGEILELTEVNVRQHVSRARKHLAEERRAPATEADQRRLLEAFLAAAQRGDRAALEGLFAADVASVTDGGGVVRSAARAPVVGRERVARFLAGFAARFWADTTLTWLEANGQRSVLVSRGEERVALATIDASTDGIERIFWVMSPAKLASVPAVAAAAGG
jgi:RNA polymerase sigma-70 factor (ECF subfamily)